MLIDAGSGTYSQLVRLFGIEGTNKRLLNLRAIWISHKHADHCQGIIQILLQLKKLYSQENINIELSSRLKEKEYECEACKIKYEHDTSHRMHYPIHHQFNYDWNREISNCGETLKSTNDIHPILIIGPMWINDIINDTLGIDEVDYRIIDAQDLTTENHPLNNYFKSELNISKIIGVPMIHSYPTYGLVLESNDWKFSYSADSSPCSSFANEAKNSTLMVHECTFDDAVKERANLTRHSTVSGALQIAKEANAKYIALTHFSTRFSRASFPIINDEYFKEHPDLQDLENRIIPAFDFMRLSINNNDLSLVGNKYFDLSKLDLA